MNRRELMRLVDEGVAIVESLSGGELSRRDEMKAVDRMLEVIDLLGGDGSVDPIIPPVAPVKSTERKKETMTDNEKSWWIDDVKRLLASKKVIRQQDGFIFNSNTSLISFTGEMVDPLGVEAHDALAFYRIVLTYKTDQSKWILRLKESTIGTPVERAGVYEMAIDWSLTAEEAEKNLLEFAYSLRNKKVEMPSVDPQPTNPIYQSVLDGAAVTIDLVKQVRAEGQKDPDHPQLRPAVRVIHGAVKAMAA